MDINARIAQLKAQIAEKEAYQKSLKDSYSNPYKKHSYANMWDYVVEGNRTGYDKEDAEAAAYQKLLMEQAQADKIRAEQTYNTAYENELNRQNALKLATQGKEAQAAYDKQRALQNKELELELLKSKRDEVARVGGNTKEYDIKINSIYKQYPELGIATEVAEWNPTNSQSYLLAKYSDYDDSYTPDELNEAISDLTKYATTDEGAKRLAQLNKALKKRQKYDNSAKEIEEALAKYATTGEVADILYELGWEEDGPAGGRYLQRNKKGAKTYRNGGKKSLPSPK